jgi:hypothetical protein
VRWYFAPANGLTADNPRVVIINSGGSFREGGGGTGLPPVSGGTLTGKMAMPRAARHPVPDMSHQGYEV